RVVALQDFVNTVLLPHQHDRYSVLSGRLNCPFDLNCRRLVAAHGINGDLDHDETKKTFRISDCGITESALIARSSNPKSAIRNSNLSRKWDKGPCSLPCKAPSSEVPTESARAGFLRWPVAYP